MSTTANDTFAGQGVTPFLASIDKQSQQEDAATIAQRCRSEVLEETSVPSDPLEFFSTWLAQATSCNVCVAWLIVPYGFAHLWPARSAHPECARG